MAQFSMNELSLSFMLVFGLLFVVQLGSLGLAFVALRRLYGYIKRYRFDESTYTLLFGFMHLRYFVIWYVVILGITALLELTYALSFLAP